jgi:hypothetical protein
MPCLWQNIQEEIFNTFIMRYRIRETDKHFIVEEKKTTWYGKEYWTHYISVGGMSDIPWRYSSYEAAVEGLLFEVRTKTPVVPVADKAPVEYANKIAILIGVFFFILLIVSVTQKSEQPPSHKCKCCQEKEKEDDVDGNAYGIYPF